jgi:Arc/MetJ-type ribon-helix-helix transcriptional regulator
MTADPVHNEERDEHLQEIVGLVHALDMYAPSELAEFLTTRGLGDEATRAVEAVAALQIVDKPYLATELLSLLALRHGGTEAQALNIVAGHLAAQVKHAGAARKISVSMPQDLTAAVQRRVGRGKFSQYVTEAVTRQLEMDLLAELSDLLASEHGPVPEEYLAEARAEWPDDE